MSYQVTLTFSDSSVDEVTFYCSVYEVELGCISARVTEDGHELPIYKVFPLNNILEITARTLRND